MSTLLNVLKGIRIDQRLKSYCKLTARFWNARTKKIQVGLIAVLALFVVSQIILPFGAGQASGPRFNFLPEDYETLLLANATRGETTWHDPVTATYGDTVSFNVYYHNGMADTVAHNTRIRVNLPTVASTQLVSTASISADNAATVTDTGTVNLTGVKPALLEYVPGSTRWLPNQNSTPKPEMIVLPDGVTQNGVNIGDIQGCWPFAGFVIFKAKVTQPGNPDLAIVKKVRNVTQDENTFVKANSANPGDILEYQFAVTNTGDEQAMNVNLADILPNKVNLIAGSLTRDSQPFAANIFQGFVNAGNLSAGRTAVYTFKVKVDGTGFPEGKTTLVNTVKTFADSIAVIQDTALTCVIVQPQVIKTPDFTLSKKVKNITRHEKHFVSFNSARPNDVLEYRVILTNTGETILTGINIKDILPSQVKFVSGSVTMYINGSATPLSDKLVMSGQSIRDLALGERVFVYFKVKVKSSAKAGIFTNVVRADADENLHREAHAKTKVVRPIRIVIEKEVIKEELVSTGTSVATIVLISGIAALAIFLATTRKKSSKGMRDIVRARRIG